MGRPETIACARCDAVVNVKARGPVPSFCADCRKSSARRPANRPSFVSCERCGSQVAVKGRGPLPRRCRGGCGPANATDVTTRRPVPAAIRPWNRAGQPDTPVPPDEAGRTQETVAAPAATTTVVEPTAPPRGGVTRIDRTHPVTVVGANDIGRRLRVQQLRHAAAIGLWVAVIAVIVLVVFIGSQPSTPDF